MKHIRHFKNIEEYNNHKNSNSFITPNISFIETERVEDRVVMYSPKEEEEDEDDLPYVSIPDNTIYYKSGYTLAEDDAPTSKDKHIIRPAGLPDDTEIVDYSEDWPMKTIIFNKDLLSITGAFFFQVDFEEVIFPKTLKYLDTNTFYAGNSHNTVDKITVLGKNTQFTPPDDYNLLNSGGILRVPKGSDYSKWLINSMSDWTIEYIRTDE